MEEDGALKLFGIANLQTSVFELLDPLNPPKGDF